MELTDPLTGRREGASMSNIRQDSLREVERTKEERRGPLIEMEIEQAN